MDQTLEHYVESPNVACCSFSVTKNFKSNAQTLKSDLISEIKLICIRIHVYLCGDIKAGQMFPQRKRYEKTSDFEV